MIDNFSPVGVRLRNSGKTVHNLEIRVKCLEESVSLLQQKMEWAFTRNGEIEEELVELRERVRNLEKR